MISIQKSMQLLQWYYHFLYLGKFMEHVIKTTDLSPHVQDMIIPTSNNTSFTLKWTTIKTLLTQIYKQPTKKNVFGYMVEINARRGVFSVMRELLQDKDNFQKFVQQTLQDQYFAFEQSIIFIRNILSHSIDSNVTIEIASLVWQKMYLAERHATTLNFQFCYADYIQAWKGSKTYGITIHIDFNAIKQGQNLTDLVPEHTLYLFAELCYNVTELFKFKTGKKKVK